MFEDWLFHALLLLAANVLLMSAYAVRAYSHEAMFAVASAVLLRGGNMTTEQASLSA